MSWVHPHSYTEETELLLRDGNNHEKEYLVTVNKPIRGAFIEDLANGVPILGTRTKKCKVVQESPTVLRMTLVQGLNRQIRRMCEHFGYEVVRLERVRIMNVDLKGLAVGEWRDLTEKELKILLGSVENSPAEPPAGRKSSRRSTQKKAPYSGTKPTGQGAAKTGRKTPAAGRKDPAVGSGRNAPAKPARHKTADSARGGARNKPLAGSKRRSDAGGSQKPARSAPKSRQR